MVFLLTVMVLVSLACSVDLYGISTPAPVINPSVQPEQLTVTSESDPSFAGAQQFYTEEFDAETNTWNYLVVNGSKRQVVNGIVGLMSARALGGLLIFDLQGQGAWVYVTYEPYTYTDVRLDVKVGNRGTNNNNVSLICRKSDAGWYQFDIASNGLYQIFFGKIIVGVVEYTIIAEGGSTKIKTGLAENEYGILCQANILALYINGTESRRLEEKKFLLPEGKVGISVSSFRDVPVTVDFYWARISQP